MEQLSLILQPYKDVVGIVACVVTIAQFFSGTVICKEIYRNKSTAGTSSIPFIGGLVVGILLYNFGLLLDDVATLVVNATSIVLNSIYIIIYYVYAKDKIGEVLKPLSYGVVVVAAALAYIKWEDKALVEYRYGLIITVLLLLLIASPLFELNDIIAKKDASSIPFPIVVMGTLVSCLWMLYGIVLSNNFMIIQNVVGLLLNIIQLLLCFAYPKKVPSKKRKSD